MRRSDGLRDRVSLDVRPDTQIDRWGLPAHTKEILGMLDSDRRSQRIEQPGWNRNRRRGLRNLRPIGRDLSENRIRETGDPLAALHPHELDGIVDHGMRRDSFEVEQLIRGSEQRGVRPVVDFDGTPGVPRQQRIEVRRCSKRAVDDLSSEGRINAAYRATAELGIEGRRRPGIVTRNPVKHAGRDVSGRRYHRAKLTRVARTGTEIGGLDKCVIT